MSRPEEHIDRVLAGLRDNQPQSGLEQRILLAVEERSIQNQQKSWHPLSGFREWSRFRTSKPSVAISGFAAVSAIALLVTVALFTMTHRSVPIGVAEKIATLRPAVAPEARLTSKPVPASLTAPQPKRTQKAHRPEIFPAHDAKQTLALQEMQAPSLVAPPLPLTAQEKALSRLGQRRRSEAIAALSDEHRAREQAEATTEFYDFFEPAKRTKSNN